MTGLIRETITVNQGPRGLKGDTGDKGDKPAHRLVGTSIQFENPDGSWGSLVDLKEEVGYHGYEWNMTQGTVARIGESVGKTAADYTFYPYSDIQIVNLSDGGIELAYLGDPTFTEDGSNGQVMTKIPKGYTKTDYFTRDGDYIKRFRISDHAVQDLEIDPAFNNGTEVVDAIYIGTYEGSVYNESAGAYLLTDEQVADFSTQFS